MNKGVPAFPTETEFTYLHGMTLRDYFAAKAMAEMTWKDREGSAQECYKIADAMLKAREQ